MALKVTQKHAYRIHSLNRKLSKSKIRLRRLPVRYNYAYKACLDQLLTGAVASPYNTSITENKLAYR